MEKKAEQGKTVIEEKKIKRSCNYFIFACGLMFILKLHARVIMNKLFYQQPPVPHYGRDRRKKLDRVRFSYLVEMKGK